MLGIVLECIAGDHSRQRLTLHPFKPPGIEQVALNLRIARKSMTESASVRLEKEDGWTVEVPNYEGIRVRCTNPSENGWFLLRLSLHDPLMPLNIESDVEGGARVIATRLGKLLGQFEYLDTNPMS